MPSLSGAVDTVPLVTALIEPDVRTPILRGFWRGDRFCCTDVRNGTTRIVEVDLDGRITTLGTLPGTGTCRFVYPAGPHVIAGVQWGASSRDTEIWLVPADRSSPRLLVRADPEVGTAEVMLPPPARSDGSLIALSLHDADSHARVRVVDDRGTTIAELGGGGTGASPECWDGDDLIVTEFEYPIESVRVRAWSPQTRTLREATEPSAPYLVEETTRGTYLITTRATGQIHELTPARKRERELLTRYRWKYVSRQELRYHVIRLGDTFLVDCDTGRSWTMLPGEHRPFFTEEHAAIAVVSRREALLLARLDDRWRHDHPPPAASVDRDALVRALAAD